MAWLWYVDLTDFDPAGALAMILAAFTFAVGVVVGAYSHKWLAKETGAPANLTVPGIVTAAETAVKDVVKKV